MTIPRSSVETGAYGSSVEFRVLGPVQALQGGATLALGGPKQRTVLALLIASAGTPVSIGSLIDGLYGDEATPGSKRTIHTYVSNLRAQVGDAITRSGDGYVLAADSIDAVEFGRLYREGRDLIDVDSGRAATRLRESLALWHGHPYADVEDRGVLSAEISRLEELRLAALEARIEADLAVGRHHDLVGELEALTEEYPLRERLRALHMLALYRSGRQSEALRAFGRTRTMLAEELGIEPSPELRDLEEAVLTQDPKLEVRVKARIERRAIIAAELDGSFSGVAERDEALARRDAILSSVASGGGGALVDVRGSAAIAAFPSVPSAFEAVSRLASEPFRLAIDVGDVEVGDDTIVGPPLVRALRLAAVANPGQALLSPEAHADLSAGTSSGWASRSLGPHRISGIDADLVVHQLLLDGRPTAFPPLAVDRLPPPLPELAAPTAVAGYELREELGAGASGTVHRAYQRSLGREVAVRTIRRDVVGDARFIRRFEAEAQRVAATEHPHLAPMIDYWREPETACIVSRLLTGGDLRTRMHFGLSSHDARTVLDHIGAAVATAHDHGLAHGRVRPENVLFDDAGHPYLTDLGMAAILYDLVAFEPDAYTAPERIMGHPDVLGDIYALGVLAAELLSGSALPADRGLPSLGGSLDGVIARATHPDPDQRHRSVMHFLDDLAAASPSEPTTPADRTELRNPYKGLAAFKEGDAGDFFGRSQLIDELIGAVSTNRLTLVVGPSGIGKSSVVRAGLVPALRRGAIEGSDSWLVTDMFPGSRPFDALADALERVAVSSPIAAAEGLRSGRGRLHEIVRDLVPLGTRLLLVVDQFEELFTHVTDEDTRLRFLDVLAAVETDVNRTVRVVATMRADFYDRPLQYSSFGELVSPRTVAVPAPSRDDLDEIIRGPAARVGLPITDGLVDALIDDADQEPGALPLLQHALTEIFEAREANLLDVRQYRDSGGLAGSIGRRGEHIYLGFSPDERQFIRQLFLRLVTVDEDAEDTRRRVRRSELEGIAAPTGLLDRVLEAFGRHRLLVFDRDPVTRGPTVEVAHEALIREWDRLRSWIDGARDDLLMRRRVEIATRDWLESGSDPSYLLSGGRLESAERWRDESGMDVGSDQTAFVSASRRLEEERLRRRRQGRRRVITSLSAALALSLAMGAIAFDQSMSAQEEALTAQSQDLSTKALAAIGEDPDLSILLALEAYETAESLNLPQVPGHVMEALQVATQSSRLVARLPDGRFSVAVSPDGSHVALDDPVEKSIVHVYRTDSFEEVRSFDTGAPIGGMRYTPGGELAVTYADNWGDVEDQSVFDGMPLVRLFDDAGRAVGDSSARCCAYDVQFAPDGVHFLAWAFDADTETERVTLGTFDEVLAADLSRGTFAPDGSKVYVSQPGEPFLREVRVDDLEEIGRLETPESDGGRVSVSPDGERVAVIDGVTRRALVIRTSDGEVLQELSSPGIQNVSFTAGGEYLITQGNDESVSLLDAEGYRVDLPGHVSGAWASASSPDGTLLFVPTLGGATMVWDITGDGPDILGNLPMPGLFRDSVPTLDGRHVGLVIEGEAGLAFEVFDLERGSLTGGPTELPANGLVGLDSSGMPSVGDGTAFIDDVRCEQLWRVGGHPRSVVKLSGPAVSNSCSGDPEVIVMAAATGDEVARLPYPAGSWIGLGPVGTRSESLFALNPGTAFIELRNLETGEIVATLADAIIPFRPVFSADGEVLVFGSQSGIVSIVDVQNAIAVDDSGIAVEASRGPVAYVSVGELLVASGHSGQALKVWSRHDGTAWFELPVDTTNRAFSVFSPGDRYLYHEDGPLGDSILRRVPLRADELVQLARSRLTRDFTVEECERFLYDADCSVYEE